MDLFGYNMPSILIKIFEKEEYANDLMAGNLYMKESGYFTKIEDNYRGDPYEARIPLEVDILSNDKSSKFSGDFPDMKAFILAGFPGDNKIPIFCSTYFNEKILSRASKNGDSIDFIFKKSYIKEMKRFGKYAVVFPLNELLYKLRDKNIIANLVSYWKITELNKLRDNALCRNYKQFFNKSIAYQQQNEYRIVIPDKQLIGEDKDCYIMSVGKLTAAQIYPTEKLEALSIKESEIKSLVSVYGRK
jgi:hypothetical protein